jgi:hypothetical protein
MTCDVAQNKLLAPPVPGRLPDDVVAHLAGCGRCRAYRERAAALDAELAALSAPSASERKAAFLDEIVSAGPVIRAVPAAPPRAAGSLREALARIGWKPTAAAAAVLVGVGTWGAWPAGKPVPVAEVNGPRSALVGRVVRYQTELATATDPKERLAKLAALAADLRAEAVEVRLAAQDKEQMRSLARMFRKVVADGLVPQAEFWAKTAPVGDRRATLTRTADALAAAAAELAGLPAPGQAQESLAGMADTARTAHDRLYALAKEGV